MKILAQIGGVFFLEGAAQDGDFAFGVQVKPNTLYSPDEYETLEPRLCGGVSCLGDHFFVRGRVRVKICRGGCHFLGEIQLWS